MKNLWGNSQTPRIISNAIPEGIKGWTSSKISGNLFKKISELAQDEIREINREEVPRWVLEDFLLLAGIHERILEGTARRVLEENSGETQEGKLKWISCETLADIPGKLRLNIWMKSLKILAKKL